MRAEVGSVACSAELWSPASLFSITEDCPALSRSPCICTVLLEILSFHIFPLVVSFERFVINLTLQARLGLVFNWLFNFYMYYIRGKRQKILTIQLSDSK